MTNDLINEIVFDALCSDEPYVNAVPVVHGEWIPVDIGDGNPGVNLECSHCGRWVKQKEMFCPKCGAKMDGGKNAAD